MILLGELQSEGSMLEHVFSLFPDGLGRHTMRSVIFDECVPFELIVSAHVFSNGFRNFVFAQSHQNQFRSGLSGLSTGIFLA